MILECYKDTRPLRCGLEIIKRHAKKINLCKHIGSEQREFIVDIHWMNAVSYAVSPLSWMALFFGAVVGSFLNVCIFRIPEGTFWARARSVCRTCGTQIPAWLNIPVFSWLFMRGRARCCGARVSVQYPLVEAFTAVMFVVVYWKFPFVSDFGSGVISFDANNAIRAGHAVVVICLMIICSVIDLHHMIIPDVISIPMVVLTPVVVYIHPDLDWQSSAIGVIVGGGSLYAVAWIYWFIRREVGMGMGDVKLLAGIGGWLGSQAILPTVLFGSVFGAVFGLAAMTFVAVLARKSGNDANRMTMKTALPFGPFLATGAVLHLLIGQFLREIMLGVGAT